MWGRGPALYKHTAIVRNSRLQLLTLLHLPPLRFHYADGCWDRTQDRCNWCIAGALTTRLDLIFTLLEHTYILYILIVKHLFLFLIASARKRAYILWGAEPRFELRTALQQADALLTEPRGTLLIHAAP
jgi:hypothetical protein